MLLMLGILLWTVVHLFVSIGAAARTRLIAKIGGGAYRALFSLVMLGIVLLIVRGWKAMPATVLYMPPPGLRSVTFLLMPIAVILFVSARAPTDIKQYLRHPQLCGVALWALAHLLSNGEIRSLILFAGLLAWTILEVIFINRRDGVWRKPAPVGMAKTLVSASIGVAISVVLLFMHAWYTGVAILPQN